MDCLALAETQTSSMASTASDVHCPALAGTQTSLIASLASRAGGGKSLGIAKPLDGEDLSNRDLTSIAFTHIKNTQELIIENMQEKNYIRR